MTIYFNSAFKPLAVLTALLSSACATPDTRPADITLTGTEGTSVIAIKYVGKHVNYFGVNSLSIIEFSEDASENNPVRPPADRRSKFIDLEYKLNSDGYSLAELPPGQYFLTHGNLPKKWAGCFNKDTVKFDVLPNKVTYLGEIDLDAFYTEVNQTMEAYAGDELKFLNYNAVTSGNSRRGPANFKMDLNYSPRFEKMDPSELKDVSDYLAKSGSKIDAPVVAANFERISFVKDNDKCVEGIHNRKGSEL